MRPAPETRLARRAAAAFDDLPSELRGEVPPIPHALWGQYRANPSSIDLRNRLVCHYAPVVVAVAMRCLLTRPAYRREELGDLVSDGMAHLVRQVDYHGRSRQDLRWYFGRLLWEQVSGAFGEGRRQRQWSEYAKPPAARARRRVRARFIRAHARPPTETELAALIPAELATIEAESAESPRPQMRSAGMLLKDRDARVRSGPCPAAVAATRELIQLATESLSPRDASTFRMYLEGQDVATLARRRRMSRARLALRINCWCWVARARHQLATALGVVAEAMPNVPPKRLPLISRVPPARLAG